MNAIHLHMAPPSALASDESQHRKLCRWTLDLHATQCTASTSVSIVYSSLQHNVHVHLYLSSTHHCSTMYRYTCIYHLFITATQCTGTPVSIIYSSLQHNTPIYIVYSSLPPVSSAASSDILSILVVLSMAHVPPFHQIAWNLNE